MGKSCRDLAQRYWAAIRIVTAASQEADLTLAELAARRNLDEVHGTGDLDLIYERTRVCKSREGAPRRLIFFCQSALKRAGRCGWLFVVSQHLAGSWVHKVDSLAHQASESLVGAIIA